MANKSILRILFIEDLPSDVDLAVMELRKEKIKFEHLTVCTREDLIKALEEFKPDLIISEYTLESFNGMEALNTIKESGSEIPVIFFTGSVNEEIAVQCIKAGALDYVIKEHMTRLPFAVKEALEHVQIQKEKNASSLLLKDSEEKIQSIFKAAPVGIGLVVNRILYEVNDKLCKITGYSRSELIGKSSEILYPTKEEYDYVGREKYRQIAEKGSGSVETLFACKNGNIINVILSSIPLDNNDLSKGVTFTVLDITDQKKAEEALRESELRFRVLYNDAVVGLYRTNSNGEILLANKVLIKILGYESLEELKERNLRITGFGQDYRRKSFIELIEKHGEVKDLEAIWTTRTGTELFVRESAKAIYDSSGKILYYDGTVEDITEKIKAETELKSSYSILNASLESTADGILIVDGKGTIIKYNQKFTDMWGIPESILSVHDDNAAINHILGKLVDPDKFLKTVRDLYSNPEKLSFDKLEFNDGRIFERFSQPQRIDDKIVGRVWSFRDVTDRYKAEESLKLSEEKFRSIAENIPDIIFITDSEGKIKYISPSCKSFGYSQDEFSDAFFGKFLDEGELDKAMQFFSNALNSVNLSNIVTLVFKRKDGSKFFAELSGSVFNVGNDEIGVLGLLRDVTDKMNKEVELRKLSQAVEQNPVSIIITDTSGRIEYVNSKLCEITGYSKKELIGNNPRVMSSGKKSAEEYKDLWDTILAGDDWKGEFHNKKKNGELYWESATVSPIKNENNIITHFLGIKEDITDKKVAEQKLVENEKRYRELFLNNPVPNYIFDEKTLEFIEVNDATVQIYGYSREEFSSMTLKDIRLPEDIPYLLDSVKNLGKETFHSNTSRHVKKNGTVINVEITSHSLPEKNGRKTRLVMVVDITERLKAAEQMKLAMEKAEASDKLKTTFLNNISHEVRTPLNGILGFAEIISQHELSEEEKKDSLAMLFESSNRLLNTINNYMDISLITAGNLTINKKDFLPSAMLRRIFNNFGSSGKNMRLKLLLDIPFQSEDIIINSDPEICQKILTHFIDNAIKFTEKGSISFGFKLNDGNIEFFVKDTGIGIAKDSFITIFDRFSKDSKSTSRVTEGSGLGLSIARGMSDAIGGKIGLVSEPGAGSCFSLIIPLNNGNRVYSHPPGSEDLRKEKAGSMILIAEDDETNFYYLNALLSMATDAKILHASNGREAIELFKANPGIKLILMDIKMPEIDGFEATRQIKQTDSNVYIIAVTAHAMSGDEERIITSGFDGYLSKPISKKNLLEKIAEFVKIR